MSHNHTHINGHHQHNAEDISTTRLFITMSLNFIITIAELIGGILSGSLALISDALHNFSDGIAIIISYIAIRLNKKPVNKNFTFGFKRADIIAAVFNASVLIGISLYLFIESYNRFVSPEPIEGGLMIIVASIGLLANVIGTLLLQKGAKGSMNIRAAYLHLMSDAVSSVAVIIGGLFIYFYNVYWIDPVLTVLISLYIIKASYSIVKEATKVLMMAAPENLSINEIEKGILELDEIQNIHHVHLWRVNDKEIHFEAHINVEDMMVSNTEMVSEKIEKLLRNNFNISHVTLQFECNKCDDVELINGH
jgi:cobalt-zinc-cadmium efflux system protein